MKTTTNNLYTRLAASKMEVGKVAKNATNPHFKKTYADINALIEAVEPILLSHGLLLLQPITMGKVSTIIIDVESGQQVSSEIEIPVTITDPQKLGSAITYFRRYTLQSLMSLQAEDDDANKASAPTATKPQLTEGSKAWSVAIEKKLPLTEVLKHYTVSAELQTKYTKSIC